jgi:threonine aldolase
MMKNNKKKYSFRNDYSEGAHPNIIKALTETNLIQQEGYGEDEYCIQAADIIRKKIHNENADVHFVVGGTQANLIVISSILRPYESVIGAETSHINTHETGAIEATGHKVCIANSKDGKLTPEDIKLVLDQHEDEHMVKPKMVYISNSTEIGTIYKKNELKALHDFCKQNGLILYLDGARIGSALCSCENDLTLEDLGKLVDVFYIGGTKNGALIGEAIVINNDELKENFRFCLKQRGALLAKGRILGIQFKELFKDDLLFKLAKHANLMADKLSKSIENLGYDFLVKSSTNQIFPIMPNELIDKLSEKYLFYKWCSIDENSSAIRLVTSWATKEDVIDEFIEELSRNK